MLPLALVTTLGLLTIAVQGAPAQEAAKQQRRAVNPHEPPAAYFDDGSFAHKRLHRQRDVVRHGLSGRTFQFQMQNGTGTTTRSSAALPLGTAAASDAAQGGDEDEDDEEEQGQSAAAATSGCGEIVTTTIDVTIYLTPTARLADEDEEDVASVPSINATVTQAPPPSSRQESSSGSPSSSSRRTTTATTSNDEDSSPTRGTTTVLTTPAGSDRDEGSFAAATAAPSSSPPSRSITTLPSSPPSSSSPTPSSTPSSTLTRTSLIIDPAMTPVATSSLPPTPARASAPSPTGTVRAGDNDESGAPAEDRTYCGVRGEPAGTYFLAEFIEDRSGVPVSLEGCYEFCDSVMESTKGCQAYRFYYSEFGAPRCALYGMPVPWIVRDLDNDEPDRWYDLECGSPAEAR